MRRLIKRAAHYPFAILAAVAIVAACAPLENKLIATPAPPPTPAPAPAPTSAPAPTPTPTVSVPATKQAELSLPAYPSRARAVANPNAFNILMNPRRKRHLPPWEDQFHDPSDPALRFLQAPLAAFASLPKTPSGAGNGVAWDTALAEGKIHPRWVLNNPKAKPAVFNLDIVFDVKGSMPNVVYPHKAHTQWLTCSNCHPAIFIPKKGANPITMASIMMGKQCGVCHGRVAFPISSCMRCHSGKKKNFSAKANAPS